MKATFQTSPDTLMVAKRLIKLQPGEILTKEDSKNIVLGRELFGKHRHIMAGAMRHVLKNESIVIACVRGVGVKRLTNDEIPELGGAAIEHIRRTSKKAASKIARSDYDSMANESKKKFNESLSVLGVIYQFSTPKAVKAIGDAAEKASSKIAPSEAIKLEQFTK